VKSVERVNHKSECGSTRANDVHKETRERSFHNRPVDLLNSLPSICKLGFVHTNMSSSDDEPYSFIIA